VGRPADRSNVRRSRTCLQVPQPSLHKVWPARIDPADSIDERLGHLEGHGPTQANRKEAAVRRALSVWPARACLEAQPTLVAVSACGIVALNQGADREDGVVTAVAPSVDDLKNISSRNVRCFGRPNTRTTRR